MIVRFGFIEPCQPSKVARPPSGPLWVHEIKRDGYRLMVRRDGSRVRCFTRNGHDWADRFPAIVDAAQRLKAQSFVIDGEAVMTGRRTSMRCGADAEAQVAFSKEISAKHQTSRSTIETSNQIQPNIAMAVVAK